ncbi:MAG: murein biosynthesis integral membrane protein MurJ [Candidatus Nanopelagicales bacterium]|nr:murein biosynthesis integral membrane protein MurJ [Candidatus Nanopelagicales bacterium]MBL6834819.1 murein biosynthesis integral membrane protein MurJ [Candidatus Nanopelagicales bacterium]
MSRTRALLGPSTVMATGTVVSRITGIARDIALAAALGFYLVSDAYSLGNSLPTIIYILVVGGALNAVFIPQLVRRMEKDDDGGNAYADRLITLTGSVLLALSILAVVAAPWIVNLYTPADYPQSQYDLAVAFARLCLPQIFFYGAYTMLSQVLNARGTFGAPMFAPIANNIVAITTFVLFIIVAGTSAAADGALTTGQVLLLGIGTTAGVVVQAAILVPILRRAGYRWRPRFDWKGQGLGKAAKLAGWTVGLVLVNQITYIVITRLAAQANVDAAASGATAAGITTYQKAHLVFMLPHSVITISIVTALLPALSRLAHEGKLKEVGEDVAGAMRLVAALVVPIAAMLFVLGSDVSVLLFGYGAATTNQAAVMGDVVSIFMIGLLPFTLFYVLLRGFYAMEDTRTPFVVTVIFSVIMLALVLWLFTFLTDLGVTSAGGPQIAGIALGYALAYWCGFVVLWWWLARRLGSLQSGATAWVLLRLLIAGGIAVLVAGLTRTATLDLLISAGLNTQLTSLVLIMAAVIVGVPTFFLAAWLLRVREVSAAVAMVKTRVVRR